MAHDELPGPAAVGKDSRFYARGGTSATAALANAAQQSSLVSSASVGAAPMIDDTASGAASTWLSLVAAACAVLVSF